MRRMIGLLESLRGFELGLFVILLVGFDAAYVLVPGTHAEGMSFYATAWAMALLSAMLVIRLVRLLRARRHPAGRRHE